MDKEDLSFEEKKYVIDKMIEVNKMKGDKDSENKKFIATMGLIGGIAVCVVASILTGALGGDTKIELNDNNKFD